MLPLTWSLMTRHQLPKTLLQPLLTCLAPTSCAEAAAPQSHYLRGPPESWGTAAPSGRKWETPSGSPAPRARVLRRGLCGKGTRGTVLRPHPNLPQPQSRPQQAVLCDTGSL